MNQPIDFDGIFDKKLAEYMEQNAGKYTEKQWESLIPKLYKNFGDTYLKSVKNTPKGYYAAMDDEELIKTLALHIEQGVPVSDFLCRELETRRPEGLIRFLSGESVELQTLAVNLLGADPRAFDGYFTLLMRENADEDVVEAICEQLKTGADDAKPRALECYEKGIRRELMLEILSRCKQRDDRIFEILLRAFRTSEEDLPMHASYLAAYGDERALPVLLEMIDRDETNYLEYQELKYAIEALGGEYRRVRDFSGDPYYEEILAQSQMMPDFSNDKKTDA